MCQPRLLNSLLAQVAACNTDSGSDFTQVTQIPASTSTQSQVALLERRLAETEKSYAALVHQKEVEIDHLTDEI